MIINLILGYCRRGNDINIFHNFKVMFIQLNEATNHTVHVLKHGAHSALLEALKGGFIMTYLYIYMFVSLTQLCVVYVVKEVMSFRRLSQLMGMAQKKTHAQALDESCVVYVETETNSWLCYLKYISKVLQGSLKGKQSR